MNYADDFHAARHDAAMHLKDLASDWQRQDMPAAFVRQLEALAERIERTPAPHGDPR